MVSVAQLVRASGCGSEGRGFESHHSPHAFNGFQALVAQLDRATDFGSVGCRFESYQVCHFKSGALAYLGKLNPPFYMRP